jgi:dTDP-glucose 4,6-dehydratase
MSERFLVTGGAGFLGSHVCERLLADGAEVECLDSFLTGRPSNVAHLLEEPRFTLVRHDITQPYEPPRRLSAVMHLACPASPAAYLAHPIHTLEVGSRGTQHALEIAARHRARFLLASTSEVYGDPEVNPQPESYRGSVSTTGPRSVYDEGKRFGEALTMAYHRQRRVDVRIARIFNSYGPRMSPGDGRAIPNFVHQALGDEPVTVYGDGSQTRSLTYVDDTVAGLLALLRSDVREPVNLGNPVERTMLEIAKEVIAATGSRSSIVFEPLPTDDPRVRCPDISRARALLGWEPEISLAEGLERTIPWFRAALAASATVEATA